MNSQSSDISIPTVESASSAIPSPSPTKTEPEGNRTRSTGAGGQLQRAREEHRWTRADIAGKLRLNVGVITALEENDYSHLPFPIFVRGYLRSYANLLNLPPEPLIAAYDHQGILPQIQLAVFPRQQSRGDRLWRLFTYIVILGLIGLVGLWWQNRDAPEHEMVGTLTIPPPAPPLTPTSIEIVKHNNSYSPVVSVPESPSRELAESRALGPPPEDTFVPVGGAPETLPTLITSASNTQPATTDRADTTPSETNRDSSPINPVPSEEGQPEITMQVTKDTWIKIKDGKNKMVFNSLLKAGKSQSIQGRAPFKVNLGRVDGVTVNYNGKPFDFSDYINGRSARFTLGKKH